MSLHNVLEQVTVGEEIDPEQVKVIPMHFEVVTLWARSDFGVPARGRQRVALLSPCGETLASGEARIGLDDHRRYRYRARFAGFPIKGSGRYVFRIEYRTDEQTDWTLAADVPVEVIVNPDVSKGSEAPPS